MAQSQITADDAAAWGQGSGELLNEVPRKADGSFDFEGAYVKGGAVAGAAICTAYGAGAAAPMCAVVGEELAKLTVAAGKAITASGTSAEEKAQMLAEDNLQAIMWDQYEALTPMLWRVLQDLHSYADSIDRPQPYELITQLLVAGMNDLTADVATTIWATTSEQCETRYTCPPWDGRGPAPTNCQGEPISEWCSYSGRPLNTRIKPVPIDRDYTYPYFSECIAGQCNPGNAPRSPGPPYMAPAWSVFSYGYTGSNWAGWAVQVLRRMETWALNLGKAAMNATRVLERATGDPFARAAAAHRNPPVPNMAVLSNISLSTKGKASPLGTAALAATGLGILTYLVKGDWRWAAGVGAAGATVAFVLAPRAPAAAPPPMMAAIHPMVLR